jgi:trans-aconitate methyltransferase
MNWLGRILGHRGAERTRPSASAAEIRAFFNTAALDEEHYPSTIDPRIYHVQLMLKHLGDLTEKRVADVGCGKGRFARIVRDQYPSASVLALDVAEAMLVCVPPGIHRCTATMTDLPLASASCDAA